LTTIFVLQNSTIYTYNYQRVGAAIVHGDTIIQLELSECCSIFMAESIAILKAIEYSITSPIHDTYITILSDYLSSLRSMQKTLKPSNIATKIHNKSAVQFYGMC